MWTNEAMNMYSAQLSKVEQLVFRALSLGYSLDEALDFVLVSDKNADVDYAQAFINSLKYPDKQVPLGE